jgi:hypothetical protein
MKRLLYVLVGAVLSAVVFGGAAMANGDGKGEAAPSGAETIAAQAPSARVALYVQGGATTGQFTVVRQQGVVSVTNPEYGTFCVKPVAGVSPAKVVPTVSTEWTGTATADGFAEWSATRGPCPAGTIRVATFVASGGGSYLNAVAFTVVID